MTENREFHGTRVEEAVQKAAGMLGIGRDELEYEVIDEGSGGFLGIGSRHARILVQNATVSRNWVNSEDVVRETFEEPPADTTVEASRSQPEADPTLTTELQQEEDSEVMETAESSEVQPVEETPEEVLQDLREFSNELLGTMDFESRVDVYDAGDYVAVDVTTPEAGLFIGQKGETIDAVQHVLNAVAYKNRPYGKRVVVDSEGYRQRRIEALQGMAHRSARRAIREMRTIELPPMNASERRTVHVYLKENTQVTTSSEGGGSNRRVTISPEN